MKSAEIKVISNCKKELNLVIDKTDLEPIRDEQIKQVRKEIQYPGFRKGKAPVNLVKSRYAELINLYTMEAAAEKGLREVLEENNIQMIGKPEAKKLEFNDDGDLMTIIEVETIPEVELKKLKGFIIARDVYKIADSFVDQTIDRFRREKAEITSVDDPITDGHKVIIDMQELDETDFPIAGHHYKDIEVRMGEKRFDEEIEKELKGLKAGDVKKVVKVYPEDYPQKEIAGKKEIFRITVKRVEEEKLPDLTDNWVEEVYKDIKTVTELKEATRKRLEYEYKKQAQDRFMDDLTEQVLQENPFDVPETLIENYLDNMVDDVKKRDPKINEENLRNYYKPSALRTIKWIYLEQKIIKNAKLEVTQEDIDTFYNEIKDEKIKELYKNEPSLMERVKNDILQKKVIDFLTANSKVTENVIDLK
ncbi:MAG: trigger factor [Calditrichaceae bacterium]|nr:trigger factor [Calditrichaceae bacterium]MBN2708414.1 trigger factor [Calditrichaceae bacterium]RQV92510.1 MAG: trigger factor [Calditrichota bacterium]